MKSIFRVVIFLVFFPAPVWAQVQGIPLVLGGDVLVIDGIRIQLQGLDSPQPEQQCGTDEKPFPCGAVARTALMDLIFGDVVSCKILGDGNDGAKLATCTAGGFDVAGNMVHTGWVVADRATGQRYRAIEDKARVARRGLWRRPDAPAWRRD